MPRVAGSNSITYSSSIKGSSATVNAASIQVENNTFRTVLDLKKLKIIFCWDIYFLLWLQVPALPTTNELYSQEQIPDLLRSCPG